MPLMLVTLTTTLLAASPCSPAQWLAPRAQGDEVGVPFGGSELPRACVPCRIEATFPGQTEPWQVHQWSFDSDGRLTRTEKRIGARTFGMTCKHVAPNEVTCVETDGGVTSRLTLEKGRLVRRQRQDWDTRYERDAAGRVSRIVTRLEAAGPRSAVKDAGAGEAWWRDDFPAGGERVTRWYLFSIVTLEYSSGRLVSQLEQRASGQSVRTMHSDAQGRYVGTSTSGKQEWEEVLVWESPRRVVRKDSTSANVLHFDEQGRLELIEEHRAPGVMGGAGDVRYFYTCDEPKPK
jgi:YD repeat-containing protein